VSSSTPQFRPLGELGRGATASVEVAELTADFGDQPTGTLVAVKRMHPERARDAAARRAFRAEGEAAEGLSHPSLVRCLHVEEDADPPYLVLAYVPGKSLAERLDESGPLPEPLVRETAAQLAGALDSMHSAGLFHGDIKPENVRLNDDGRAVLVDLGFSGSLHEAREHNPGSLRYLSPERARGEPPSQASDVFALGVTLYEVASGQHPFDPTDPAEAQASFASAREIGISSRGLMRKSVEAPGADRLLAAISTGRFVPPSRYLPQLSPFLDDCLRDMLLRDPGARPRAAELETRFAEGESSTTWREEARSARATRSPRESLHLTQLIGRGDELAELDGLYEELVDESPRGAIVWIEAQAGMGKSRLIESFVSRVRAGARPATYLYARCSELAESRPSGVLLDLVRRHLALPRDTPPSEADRKKLQEVTPPHHTEVLLDTLSPSSEGVSSDLPAALVAWLGNLSDERPLIVFVDDVHLASALTRRTIRQLAGALHEHRILLVLGIRPEEDAGAEAVERLRHRLEQAAGRPGAATFRKLELTPLTEPDVIAWTVSHFHKSVPRRALGKVLWQRCRGNPGLLVEVLRGLLSSGFAQTAASGGPPWTLSITPGQIPLPGSLNKSIADRFKRLRPLARRWVGRLAVVGGRIDPEFLARAFPNTPRPEIDEILSELARRGWIVAAGRRYRFSRPALREAVYRSLPRDQRLRTHAAAARALASGVDPSLDDDFQRAFHLRAAQQHAELLVVLRPLVANLRTRSQPHRLRSLALWALDALSELPDTEEHDREQLSYLELAADAADRLGLRQEQRELLDELADRFDPVKRPAEAARVYLLHARFAQGTGQYGLARGFLTNAVQLAGQAGERNVRSHAHRRLALVQAQVGDFSDAYRQARRAIADAEQPVTKALAYLARAHTECLEDRIERTLRSVDAALRLLPEDSAAEVRAFAHLLRARAWRSAGRAGRAMGAAQRAVRLARTSGERSLETEALARVGMLYLDADRAEEAEATLREALLLAEGIEDRRGRILAGIWLGIVLWETGDPTAREATQVATQAAHEIGFQRAEAVGLSLLARMDQADGDAARALEQSERAVLLLETRGAELFDRLVILGTRSMVLDAAGDAKGARALESRARKYLERENRRASKEAWAAEQRAYGRALLDSALSLEGAFLPRTPTPPD